MGTRGPLLVLWYPAPQPGPRLLCEAAIGDALRTPLMALGAVTVRLILGRNGVLRVGVSRVAEPGARCVRDVDLAFRVVAAVRELGLDAMPVL